MARHSSAVLSGARWAVELPWPLPWRCNASSGVLLPPHGPELARFSGGYLAPDAGDVPLKKEWKQNRGHRAEWHQRKQSYLFHMLPGVKDIK